MFRYQPPKSSVWGHLLRKMPAQRVNALLNQFFTTAVAEYKFSSASLGIQGSPEQVERYEHLLGMKSHNGFFPLNHEQSAKCIQELIKEEASDATAGRCFTLVQAFEISKWRLDGLETATRSLVMIHYGQLPCISTFFQFETVEQFRTIKRVLENIGLCKLNEKHLKPTRVKKASSP